MSTKPFDQDPEKDGGSSPKNGDDQPVFDHVDEQQKGPILTRFVSSFQRDPNTNITHALRAEDGGFDHEGAAQRTANSGLVRKLKGRHLQMIAIGGSIGEFNANQLERGVANNP
jgi:amino acid transporter